MPRALTVEQILSRGVRTDDGCLCWPGTTNGKGYGRIMIHGKLWLIHRYIWTKLRGPIPDSMTIDHECHNSASI
jgi:hypothetical protein